MRQLIDKLHNHINLEPEEITSIMEQIMSGQAGDEDIASFLLAINDKGPTVNEISAAAKVMRKFVLKVDTIHEDLLDTCGTGGDKKKTINISTMTAFVVAAAGCHVAKHGNRSVSSLCGSACLLEGLGLRLDLDTDELKACLDEVGIAFLFAQQLHPAMKHVAAVRRKLKVQTIFNILGPLTNPASASHQIMGVYSRDLLAPMTEVLKNLGLKRALVVHGADGLDEVTVTDKTFIAEFDGKDIISYDIDPEEIGLQRYPLSAIEGGDIDANIKVFNDVLSGKKKGAHRDIVLINAAYALYAAGKVQDITQGLTQVTEVVKSGAAMAKFEQLRDLTIKLKTL